MSLVSVVYRDEEGAWRKALLDAADYIECQGWSQGGGDSRGGPVCMVGAITTVCVYSKPYTRAIDELKRMLNAHLMEWNNQPGRTKDEVISALRRCAHDVTD